MVDPISDTVISAIFKGIWNRMRANRLSVFIRDLFNRSKMNAEVKSLVKFARARVLNRNVFDQATFDQILSLNEEYIIRWVINIDNDYRGDIENFQFPKIWREEATQNVKLLFEEFYRELTTEKQSTMSIGNLNVLSSISSIFNSGVEAGGSAFLDNVEVMLKVGKVLTARSELLEENNKVVRDIAIPVEHKYKVLCKIADTFLLTGESTDQTDAVKYLDQAVQYTTNEIDKLRLQALSMLLIGKFNQAKGAILQALAIRPDDKKCILTQINILVGNQEYEAAVEVLEKYKDLIQDSYVELKVWMLMKSGGGAEVVEEYGLSEFSNESYDLSIFIASVVHDTIEGEIQANGQVPEESILLIRRSVERLTQAIEHLDPELPGKLGRCYTIRGSFNGLLQKYPEADADYKQALAFENNPSNLIFHLAVTELQMGEYQNALQYIRDPQSSTSSDEHKNLLECEILLEMGDAETVLQLAEEYGAKTEIQSYKSKYMGVRIKALTRLMKTTRAEEELEIFESEYPDSPDLLVTKLQQVIRFKSFEGFLSQNTNISAGGSPIERRFSELLLAEIYLRSQRNDLLGTAISLLEKYKNKYLDDSANRLLVQGYFDSRDYANCITLCNDILEESGYEEYYNQFIAASYYASQHIEQALVIYTELLRENPSSHVYIANYAMCKFRLGEYDQAYDALRQAEMNLSGSEKDLIFLSSVYQGVKAHEKAIEFAYRAIEVAPGDANVHLYYINAIQIAGNFIRDIDNKYVTKFQDCMGKFSARFPDNKSLQSMSVPENPEAFKAQISDILQDEEIARNNLESIYMSNRIPLSILAKARGRSIIETWNGVIQEGSLKLWMQTGAQNEVREDNNCARNAVEIVLDTPSLLLLKQLDLFNLVLAQYRKIYVHQSFLDEISNMMRITQMSITSGHMTVWSKGGKVFRSEISADRVQQNYDYLQDLISVIVSSKQIEVVGDTLKGEHTIDHDLRETMVRSFDTTSAAIVIMAIEMQKPFYSDDHGLRRFVGFSGSNKSFNTYSFLSVLRDEGKIDEERFNDCVLELITLGYHFVPVDAKLLMYALEKHSFVVNPETLLPFNTLKHQDNALQNLMNVSVMFLKILWKDAPVREDRTKWTDILLSNITFNRDGVKILAFLQNKYTEILHPLLEPVIGKDFKYVLEQWLNVRV